MIPFFIPEAQRKGAHRRRPGPAGVVLQLMAYAACVAIGIGVVIETIQFMQDNW